MKLRWLQYFSRHTTVHGLHIIGIPKLHIIERLFWLCMVITATTGAAAIVYSNWMRFVANPTVVSLQKDFRNWENPFPAVTGCLQNKMDEKKAARYISQKWNVSSEDHKYNYYLKFVEAVANVSYLSLRDFEEFLDGSDFAGVDMLDLAITVHPQLSGTLVTFDTKHDTDWTLIMTEMGICFSVNSKFSRLLSITNGSAINDNILRCHYLNGLCYARYDSDPQLPLVYYVHSYLDVIHATSDRPLYVGESEELEINYRMQQTQSSAALRSLHPSQRRCRFDDEPLTGDIAAFSTGLCHMVCRYRLALKLCGCRAFFYHRFEGRTCNISGLVCISKLNITAPLSDCQCPQPCDKVIYFPETPKFTKWEYGYFDQRITFRWGLLPPTTKYRRDVIFGFEDLVVSFGGSLSLFLGFSFISALENVFLLVESCINSRKNRMRRPLS